MQLRKIRICRSRRLGSFSVFDMMMAPSTTQDSMSATSSRSTGFPRRIDRSDAAEDFAEARVPVPHRLRGEFAHFAVEQPLLIADAGDQAAGMAVRQVGHGLGEQLQRNQERLQRIVGQLPAAREDIVEQPIVGRDIAAEHFAGERVLVPEVVEEAALGEPGLGDHFVDRGGAKSLGEDGGFRDLENPFARCFAFSHPSTPGKLYSRYEFLCARRLQRFQCGRSATI